MKKFRNDYGVYVCDHVFKKEKPVLLVIRDPDGYWQFLCGDDGDTDDDCHHVGVGHLIDRDTSLSDMTELDVGSGAERASINDKWNFFELDD